MKDGIHPTVYSKAKTTCTTCGTVYTIANTVEEQTVETCANCHPIYTGKQRQELKGGRVERFRKRMAATSVKEKKPEAKPKTKTTVKSKVVSKAKSKKK